MGSFSLDGSNLETRQKGCTGFTCRRFYYIDCGTTCFADIPSLRSKLSKTLWSIICWIDSLKKEPIKQFWKIRWDAFTAYIDRSTAICRGIPYTFLLGSLSLFLMIFCWSNSDEMQTWRSSDPDSKTPCHSYLRECAICACLQSLLRNVFFIKIFHSWKMENEIDYLDG